MSTAWDRFVHEAETSDASLEGGVYGAQTQPAPYLDDPNQEGWVGSIPRDALAIGYVPVVDLWSGRTVAFDSTLFCRAEGLTEPRDLIERATLEHRLGELGCVGRELALQECPGRALIIPIHPLELDDGWLLRPEDPIYTHDAEIYALITPGAPLGISPQQLRELCRSPGVQLAIDEFGGEHSNLSAIVEWAPVLVKMAPSLIVGIETDARRQEVVGRLLELFSSLGAHVVAKGVTGESQLETLRDCGIRFAQGPLLGGLSALPTVARCGDVCSPPAG